MNGVFKIKIWFKITGVIFAIASTLIAITCILDHTSYDIYELVCIILCCVGVTGLFTIWSIYLVCFKIIIKDDTISIRKFLKINCFCLADITDVDYKRIAFGDYTYVIKVGRKKIEISPFIKDKKLIDKFFEENGIFKKFPRVEY